MSSSQAGPTSTGSQLLQRIQQLQAEQAISPNPAYQPPSTPPQAPVSFDPASAPYLADNKLAQPPSSSLFSTSTSGPLFGSFGNSSCSTITSITPNCSSEISKEEPDYCAPSPNVDPLKTLERFEHLLKLPVEIIELVAEQCSLQDGVCLSLTSKDLYALVRPLLLRRDKEAYSLSRMSKFECRHVLSKTEGHKACTLEGCRQLVVFSGQHCATCTSCPLYIRLGNDKWSGLPSKQFSYCSKNVRYWVNEEILGWTWQQMCERFKLREKFWKGKCLHGGSRPKPRKVGQGTLTWTHMKGEGGWQRNGRMWETLYTESDLRKFQRRYMEERRSSESTGGYNLRRKPKPTSKRVEHVNLHYRVDLENPNGRGPVEGTKGWDEEVQEREYYYY